MNIDTKMNKSINKPILKKLDYFVSKNKIPNLIFYGDSGSGKSTIINYLIDKIYKSNLDHIKKFVMFINCAHGKGIKFIRENLKFFAKTHINIEKGLIKSIILLNADKLTVDAQSALRRCIEQYSHTTRFFIKVENCSQLLKPITSRFSNIYVPIPKQGNLHKFFLNAHVNEKKNKRKRLVWLNRYLNRRNINNGINYINLLSIVTFLYQKGYNCIDVVDYINQFYNMSEIKKKYKILLYFHKIKKDIRNEKILMYNILAKLFLRFDDDLINISFI
jgi:DNA polymerase III delta prime subunit